MNSIAITGRVCSEPEQRMTRTGKCVASFSLAVKGRKDKDGLGTTMFIDVTAFSSQAEYTLKYFHKGDMIAVNGSLESSTYTTKEGAERTKFFISAHNVELLKKAAANWQNNGYGNNNYRNNNSYGNYAPAQEQAQEPMVNDEAKALEVDDDDCPF